MMTATEIAVTVGEGCAVWRTTGRGTRVKRLYRLRGAEAVYGELWFAWRAGPNTYFTFAPIAAYQVEFGRVVSLADVVEVG